MKTSPVVAGLILAVIGGTAMLTGCGDKAGVAPGTGADQFKPKLLVSCGEDCNTPDAARLNTKTGDMIVACPNFNSNGKENKHPGKLMKITRDNKWEFFSDIPVHPETGRACPMGMDFGPDGNLYVADNQYFNNKGYKSRLIRVKVQDGKAAGCEVVVEGFKLANAVMFKGNAVFVSDTFFDLPDKALSGIYRIGLDEMNQGKPVKLLPKNQHAQDSHCIATWETLCNDPGVAHRKGEKAGADGLTFDAEGNLYSGNFGDGVMHKITFKSDGSVASCTQFVKDWPRMTCVDGIFFDAKRNCIYVADSEKNAVQVVWLPEGKVTTLWENADTDGSGGLLDQPCEPALRGDELIVINFDMPFPGLRNTTFDKPYTISVINVSGHQRPK